MSGSRLAGCWERTVLPSTSWISMILTSLQELRIGRRISICVVAGLGKRSSVVQPVSSIAAGASSWAMNKSENIEADFVRVVAPKAMDGLEKRPVTLLLPLTSTEMEWASSLSLPPAPTAQSEFPEASYFAMNMSFNPALVRVVEPKAMDGPQKQPVTILFPSTATEIEWASSLPLPPAPIAQSAFPEPSYFAMNKSPYPALDRVVEPKVMEEPSKEPAT